MSSRARRWGHEPAEQALKAPRETLEIGRYHSRCIACGNAADPTELSHTTRLGYDHGDGKGCGITWTHVRATYYGPAEAESVREMRPDLEFLG